MKKGKNLVKLFSGTEASSILLKKRLDEAGINALIKNDSDYAFFGVTPRVVDLYVEEEDLKISRTIIQDLNMDSGQ